MARPLSIFRSPDPVVLPAPARLNFTTLAICILLAVLVLGVFGQTFQYAYINYDDDGYVSNNMVVLKGLTPEGIGRAFTQKQLGLWTPLTTLSHMVVCQICGPDPGWHHLANVLLHLGSTLLLFLILNRMTGSLWPSAFVAAVFAIHPLRVESVAWIAERKDTLSGLFFMLTLGAYLHYVQKPAAKLRYISVIALFGMGVMAKAMLVTVPFLFLLLDCWPLNRLLIRSADGKTAVQWPVLLEKIPLLMISLVLSLFMVLTPEEPGNLIKQLPLDTRMALAPIAFVTYLQQIVRPVGLALVYPYPEIAPSAVAASTAVILILTAIFVLLRKKYPFLLMGWLWNLGMMVPVCGIKQISRHWQADHYTYLPQIGIYILVAWGIAALTANWKRRPLLLGGMAGTLLLAYGIAAYRLCSTWKDSETLWTYTLSCTAENALPHSNLGTHLLNTGRDEEALPHLEEAIRINPLDLSSLGNLGVIYLRKGDSEKAVEYFNRVLAINPHDSKSFNNFAWSLATNPRESGRDGKKALEFALKASSEKGGYNPYFLDTLAAANAELGNFPEAIKWAETAATMEVPDKGLTKQIMEHLESYRQNKAWREIETPKNSGGFTP